MGKGSILRVLVAASGGVALLLSAGLGLPGAFLETTANPGAQAAAQCGRLSARGTFHCEDCLLARVPGPVQQACARAWVQGASISAPSTPRFP